MQNVNVSETQLEEIKAAATAQEPGDVRSLLDEVLPSPSEAEKTSVLSYLKEVMPECDFNFDAENGWYY